MSGTLKVGGKTLATHDTNTNVSTLTADEANVGSNALVVDSSGNVGIGTSSPSYNIDVKGSTGVSAQRATDTDRLIMQWDGFTSYGNSVGAYNNIKFTSQNNSGSVERMRIDSSGNVGIGTSSPSYKLHVRSADATSIFVVGNTTESTQLEVLTHQDDRVVLRSNDNGNGRALAFETGTSQRMRIDSNGSVTINTLGSGDVYASLGTLYIGSDIRLKNDLGVIDESGIEIIKQLTPRYYSWKNDENSRQQLGFFAQEVFPILPEAVPRDLKYEQNGVDENGEPILEQVLDDNGEPDYQWGFATQPIVAMCVKAIQEQQTIIESQQSQIDALTVRIEALEATP